jgi:excisionase family DNA binding protein
MAGEQDSNKSSKETHTSGPGNGSETRPPAAPHRESGVIRKANMDMPGEIMTRSEVAELLRCSEPHVVALIEREALPAFRLGKLWRFRRSEVLAWCERRENGSRTA